MKDLKEIYATKDGQELIRLNAEVEELQYKLNQLKKLTEQVKTKLFNATKKRNILSDKIIGGFK